MQQLWKNYKENAELTKQSLCFKPKINPYCDYQYKNGTNYSRTTGHTSPSNEQISTIGASLGLRQNSIQNQNKIRNKADIDGLNSYPEFCSVLRGLWKKHSELLVTASQRSSNKIKQMLNKFRGKKIIDSFQYNNYSPKSPTESKINNLSMKNTYIDTLQEHSLQNCSTKSIPLRQRYVSHIDNSKNKYILSLIKDKNKLHYSNELYQAINNNIMRSKSQPHYNKFVRLFHQHRIQNFTPAPPSVQSLSTIANHRQIANKKTPQNASTIQIKARSLSTNRRIIQAKKIVDIASPTGSNNLFKNSKKRNNEPPAKRRTNQNKSNKPPQENLLKHNNNSYQLPQIDIKRASINPFVAVRIKNKMIISKINTNDKKFRTDKSNKNISRLSNESILQRKWNIQENETICLLPKLEIDNSPFVKSLSFSIQGTNNFFFLFEPEL